MDAPVDAFPDLTAEDEELDDELRDEHGFTEADYAIAEALGENDDELQARLDAEAEADIGAGRVIPAEDVFAWLEARLTDPSLPMPQPWLK